MEETPQGGDLLLKLDDPSVQGWLSLLFNRPHEAQSGLSQYSETLES